jgi:3-methylcrotonyl-CoA carboxylase alpha subunit
LPPGGAPDTDILLLAAGSVVLGRAGKPGSSPWHGGDSFRLNLASSDPLNFRWGEEVLALSLHHDASGYGLQLADGSLHAFKATHGAEGLLAIDTGERRFQGVVSVRGESREVFYQGQRVVLTLIDPLQQAGEEEVAAGSLLAPMPGAITALLVAVGDVVSRGQALLVLEAMKIEHTIAAPFDGRVSEIFFAKGQQVTQEGAELVRLEALEAASED